MVQLTGDRALNDTISKQAVLRVLRNRSLTWGEVTSWSGIGALRATNALHILVHYRVVRSEIRSGELVYSLARNP